MPLPKIIEMEKNKKYAVPAVEDSKTYEKLEMELEDLETEIVNLEYKMVNEVDLLTLQKLQDELTVLETKRSSLYLKLEEIL